MHYRAKVLSLSLTTALGCAPKADDGGSKPAPEVSPTGDNGGSGQTELPPRAIAVNSLDDMPTGGAALVNLDSLVSSLGLSAYHQRGFRGQGLTVAVLDNGFVGLEQSAGIRLPPDIKVEPAPRATMQNTTHGLKLAEIVYALATGSTSFDASRPGPKILLFNTNGFTNFQAAVAGAMAAKADIILYAQVWEYGGNFDGGGFINREVEKATEAGILWVNAAGNMGQAVYSGPVLASENRGNQAGDIPLPYNGRYLRLTVPRDQTSLKLVLAWNDFDESVNYRTPQDLDLILEDASGRKLGEGRLRQLGPSGNEKDTTFSAYAREIINVTLDAGTYLVRAERKSQNFDATSRIRISAEGEGVRILEAAPNDSLLIPADNPQILTVGAADVETSGRAVDVLGRQKPELAVTSLVTFADGEHHSGTSAASAIVVGGLVAFTSAYGRLTRDEVVGLIDKRILAVREAPYLPPVLKLPDPAALLGARGH